MLYRLSPPGEVTWSDLPTETIQLAQDNHADLARLLWAPTETRAFSSDLLRLALRYGVPCGDGIVVSAVDVADLGRADELRLLNRQSSDAHRELRSTNGAFMEQLSPGWTAQGEELDRRIIESTEHTAREAEADLDEQLAATPKPEVVEHWNRLGGNLPDPL